MDWSLLANIGQVVEGVGIVVWLTFISVEVLKERRQEQRQTELQEFQLYQTMENHYTDLLKMADRDPVLNDVWEPMDKLRYKELKKAHREASWGAWYEMDFDEKRCYRYTRYAIELFEQAHRMRKRNLIYDDSWSKWLAWMSIWRNSRYFRFVFEDTEPRLTEDFVQNFEILADQGRDNSGMRRHQGDADDDDDQV